MREWYRKGLRFRCARCGDCCTGAPGHVWITPGEERRIARLLRLAPARFRRRYTRRVEERRSLVEKAGGDCVFLTPDRRCAVQGAKPRQCLAFPFWPAVVATPAAWRERGRTCPGMGRGDLYAAAEVRRIADPATPRQSLVEILAAPRGPDGPRAPAPLAGGGSG
ncbi:MAG: YkgJ family cysteine cluster protein [Planctomycetota bacterium]